MTHNVHGVGIGRAKHGVTHSEYYADNSRTRTPFGADSANGAGNTRTFSAGTSYGNRREFDFAKARRKKDGGESRAGLSTKGRVKFGEARREAGRRRKFVERRRGLLFALSILVMFLLTLLLIYKVLFVVRDVTVVGAGVYTSDELLEASGVSEGVNLYSFRASTVESKITLNCPYINDVEIDREIPNKVTITVTEDTAVYYTVVFGEYKLLSAGLRVLETVSAEEDVPEGLIKLKLPTVSYSVTGRVLEFANEKRERGIREVLEATVDSPVAPKLTVIDVRDQFDISMISEGKHKLILGGSDRLEYKLRTASKVLEDEMFATDNKIRVDLTTDGKTGVIIDNLMELD